MMHRLGAVLTQLRQTFALPVGKRLWKFAVALALYSYVVAMVVQQVSDFSQYLPPHHSAEAVLTGILFGWLLNFRTNIAHARWWEARTAWGQLVNESRNLSLKAACYLPAGSAAVAQVAAGLAAFAEALRSHLVAPARPLAKSETVPSHEPMQIARAIYAVIFAGRENGELEEWATLSLDEHAKKLMDVCGTCERIKNTPLTLSYRGLLRLGLCFYLLLLPWVLADELGSVAVAVAALIGSALIGLELIAGTIETPFGSTGDDLALNDFVTTIRANVLANAAQHALATERASTATTP